MGQPPRFRLGFSITEGRHKDLCYLAELELSIQTTFQMAAFGFQQLASFVSSGFCQFACIWWFLGRKGTTAVKNDGFFFQSWLQLGPEKKDLGWDLKRVVPLLSLFWAYLFFLKWDRQRKDSLKPENIKIIASKLKTLLREGLLIQLLNLQCKEMRMSEIPSQSKERLGNLIWPTPGFCFSVRQNLGLDYLDCQWE